MGVKFNCGSFGSKMSQIDFQKGVQKLGLWSRIRQKRASKWAFKHVFANKTFEVFKIASQKGGQN